MHVGSDSTLAHEVDKYFRIACGYFLAVEPLDAIIFHLLGYGEREAALAEAKAANHLHLLLLLKHLVKPHDANVGSACGNRVGNVVIAQKKKFHGEVARWHQQGALHRGELDAGLLEQFHGLIVEAAFRLYCNSKHVV